MNNHLGLFNGFLSCDMHRVEPNVEPIFWCHHIDKEITSCKDARFYSSGMKINVPIMPTENIWTTVHISKEEIAGGSALMEMEYTPEFGKLQCIELGFWNPGEGLRSMRSAIIDYLRSQLHPHEDIMAESPILTKCPSSVHNTISARKMQGLVELGPKWRCLWNIVMEKACTFCIEQSNDSDLGGLDKMDNRPAWQQQQQKSKYGIRPPAPTGFPVQWNL